jgi:energy-coupling factor transport system substrate-specific component
MTWQAAIFLILAATLVAGVVWYERSRPPSQVVALVAALAALAVAGRVALSPIPNVVPTTDIALLSGYALGGAPGFAVGALAGLVSNFWLGQGPWTPWQMAGWGMTGVLGAGLAAATGRSIGRVALAAWCAGAGFAYGALLDFSLMVTYGGEQSLDRFLALSARGIPFNVAHAAGNAALALVAGPAIVRMLLRYRRRFEFAWGDRRVPGRSSASPPRRRGATAGAASLLVALLVAAPLLLGDSKARGAGARSPVAWLAAAQNPDGGIGIAPGTPSSPVMTGWACLGLEASGRNPRDLRRNGQTPISYLRRTAGEIRSVGDIERTALVLAGAGVDPRRFGRDLVARLRNHRLGDGSWPGQVNPTAYGILALSASGSRGGLGRSAAWLRSAQNADGGWGFARGSASDPDSTGAAIQALVAAGGSAEAIANGVGWLRRSQAPGGGFALAGGSPNAQSTALAALGLIAAGVSPSSVRNGGSPLDYLASVRAPDGHYRYSASSDQTPVWVTGQALVAASGKAFPLEPVARRPSTAGNGSGGDDGQTGGVVEAGQIGAGGAAAPAGPGPKPGKAGAPAPAPGPAGGPQSSPVSLAPTLASEDSGDSGTDPLVSVLVGAGVLGLGAAVWGGWTRYRRRLP